MFIKTHLFDSGEMKRVLRWEQKIILDELFPQKNKTLWWDDEMIAIIRR